VHFYLSRSRTIIREDNVRDHPEEVWIQLYINLSRYIDSRVCTESGHSAQVAYWGRSTARVLEVDEDAAQRIFLAAMLHDIGKIGVPDQVLIKNGPLSEEEWAVMKLHPTIGANMVRTLKKIRHIAPDIQTHQERYDGSGYPHGLRGENIPIGGRILAVVDAYEAMTHNRVYRRACSHEDAVAELHRMQGRHFDPWVVEGFLFALSASTRPMQVLAASPLPA
jgi:putative nucleotidyltransferase with HDIG domain